MKSGSIVTILDCGLGFGPRAYTNPCCNSYFPRCIMVLAVSSGGAGSFSGVEITKDSPDSYSCELVSLKLFLGTHLLMV